MKTLVVPMHGSIGVAVSPFLEQHHYDRVILVHPWSENDSAHNNAEHLREYFGDRLNRHRMQERDLHQTKFEVRAMDCSQKPLEVAEYFSFMINRDIIEVDDLEPEYHVLLVEETPTGYIIGAMAISGEGHNIRCLIGSLGYDIRRPKRREFNPDAKIGESFQEVPLLGHIHDVLDWLSSKKGTTEALAIIHKWYQNQDPIDWEMVFKTSEIAEDTEWSQSRITNHIRYMIDFDHPLIEDMGSNKYRITRIGRQIGWKIIDS